MLDFTKIVFSSDRQLPLTRFWSSDYLLTLLVYTHIYLQINLRPCPGAGPEFFGEHTEETMQSYISMYPLSTQTVA